MPIIDGLAVDSNNDVTGLQAGASRRCTGHNFLQHGPLADAQTRFTNQLWGEGLILDTQKSRFGLTRFDQLPHDVTGDIAGDGKP
jgi:hypothetical protein